uniref:Uncharacterized protein n=1 Tax=Panagrolaimus sp. PS1159 TaxID=55785 RepID=A0AC35GBU0_9BILA
MDDLFYFAAIFIAALIFISCIIHCIYRCCKCCCYKSKSEENGEHQINTILLQDYEEICQLPKVFGKNAKLYSVTNNLDRGIAHVYSRHSNDFKSETDVAKSLKKNLISSKLIGEEADSRGNRYIWKSNDRRGSSKEELVTILSPRHGGDFELITAYYMPVSKCS